MDTPTDIQRIEWALGFLRHARDHLKMAGAKKAADAVRRAMKSAEGAERHASVRPSRARRQARAEHVAALRAVTRGR